uniref:Secreted protein n=1 Tax=Pyxicephalus adspersus TaxID=30357 RepID=A0AAV3BAP6_PYXAD|nr:TPA: hypothetical protein GDO54_001228 [Pyxicephalus adspersus]
MLVNLFFLCAHRPMTWGLASEQNIWTTFLSSVGWLKTPTPTWGLGCKAALPLPANATQSVMCCRDQAEKNGGKALFGTCSLLNKNMYIYI